MIKGAVIVDPIGDRTMSDDEQVRIWSDLFGRVFKNKARFKRCGHPCEIPLGTRVVLFDYGAAGLLSEAQVASNVRGFLTWCSDNPWSIGIVISEFTWPEIARELLDWPNIHNVILWGRDKIPAWFEGPVMKQWRQQTDGNTTPDKSEALNHSRAGG